MGADPLPAGRFLATGWIRAQVVLPCHAAARGGAGNKGGLPRKEASMKYVIVGKNMEVTESLKDAVTQKLDKLDKFFSPDTEIHDPRAGQYHPF